MSSDDYQVQDIHRYSRKSYKKGQRDAQESDVGGTRVNHHSEVIEVTPRSDDMVDGQTYGTTGCSCDIDPDGEIANILHKKCPVITLAQQQLQKLLDETDKLLCDNTRCCRSVYDFLCICKELLLKQNKCQCVLIVIIGIAFLAGLLIGAASCGSYHGRFDSPILTCIDKFFIPDTYSNIKDTYLSVT